MKFGLIYCWWINLKFVNLGLWLYCIWIISIAYCLFGLESIGNWLLVWVRLIDNLYGCVHFNYLIWI